MAGAARRLVDPVAAIEAGWEALKLRIRAVVEECNCEAGEPMWAITEEGGALRIRDRSSASSCVEVTLDGERRVLSCRFGPASRRTDWAFEIMPDGTTFRHGDTPFCIAKAADAILDRLVSR